MIRNVRSGNEKLPFRRLKLTLSKFQRDTPNGSFMSRNNLSSPVRDVLCLHEGIHFLWKVYERVSFFVKN